MISLKLKAWIVYTYKMVTEVKTVVLECERDVIKVKFEGCYLPKMSPNI